MNEYIKNSINELNAANDKLESEVKERQGSVKPDSSNDATPEDPFGELGLLLFKQITDTTIKIMETPEVEKSLTTIATEMNMGEKSISSLINLIAIAMTNSAYQAIIFYDDLLKDELTKQFENVGNHINMGKADMEGFKAALQIHQKQIGEINKTLLLNNLKKANDVGGGGAGGIPGGALFGGGNSSSIDESSDAPAPNAAKPFK